jgi:Ca2+-binding EF-hand superfamily protein
MDGVKAAYSRMQALSAKRKCEDLSLSKHDFWDIFTDYATVVNGQFLCLPIEQFELFDPENTGKVYALEVFSALLLFCNANLPSKVEFIFVLFDFDKSGGISRDEMVMMLRCVTRALFRVGFTSTFPEYDEIEPLAEELFAELGTDENGKAAVDAGAAAVATNGGGAAAGDMKEASLQQIQSWAMTQMSNNNFVSRFCKEAAEGLHGINRKKSMENYFAVHGDAAGQHEKVSQGIKRKASKRLRRKMSDIVPEYLVGRMRYQVQKATRLASGRVLLRASTTSLGKELRSDRKNMLQRVATRACISDLARETSFSLSEVKQLRADYAKHTGADSTLTKDGFNALLLTRFPKLKGSSLLDRLYSVFDADGGGTVDFREFCTGLTRMLKGSAVSKLNLLFELYDENGDGTIGMTEIMNVVLETNKSLASEAQFAAQIMQTLDVDGDGAITQEEFVQVLNKEPALMSTFSRTISQRVAGSLKHQHALLSLDTGNEAFNYTGIVALVKELAEDPEWNTVHEDHTVTAWEFKQMMSDHFQSTQTSVKFFDRVYSIFDADHADKVDLRDLLNALVQTIDCSDAETAAFFFNLYDFDGSGTLEADELLRLILESDARTGKDAKKFLEVVSQFDKNGDHSIDCAEFRDAMMSNPELMGTFGLLFGATGGMAEMEEGLGELAMAAAEAEGVAAAPAESPAVAGVEAADNDGAAVDDGASVGILTG